MTAFDNIAKAKSMWELIVPQIPLPSEVIVYRWLRGYTIEELEDAIPRIIWRFRDEDLSKVNPEKAHRFVTSILKWNRAKNLKQQQQLKHKGAL